jgi:hypothetical protein
MDVAIPEATVLSARDGHPSTCRRRVKRAVVGLVVMVASLVGLAVTYVGVNLYRIDHAVHHIGISASLLAEGRNDLLTVIEGPDHHEEVYVFHATGGHMNVLNLPEGLSLRGSGGQAAALSSFNIRRPAPIIQGLRELGIPVGRYVGVDLHAVSRSSALGQLAMGKVSLASLLSNPVRTASVMAAAASHVYLGPNTSVSALLSLIHVPSGTSVSVPTTRQSDGNVVLAVPVSAVLRTFL